MCRPCPHAKAASQSPTSSGWHATLLRVTIPPLILYIFFQRYFVEGIAASGVKG